MKVVKCSITLFWLWLFSVNFLWAPIEPVTKDMLMSYAVLADDIEFVINKEQFYKIIIWRRLFEENEAEFAVDSKKIDEYQRRIEQVDKYFKKIASANIRKAFEKHLSLIDYSNSSIIRENRNILIKVHPDKAASLPDIFELKEPFKSVEEMKKEYANQLSRVFAQVNQFFGEDFSDLPDIGEITKEEVEEESQPDIVVSPESVEEYPPREVAEEKVAELELHKAIKEGKLGTIKRLLEQDPPENINEYDSEGRSAICRAAAKGYEEIVYDLVDLGTTSVRDTSGRGKLFYEISRDTNLNNRMEEYWFGGVVKRKFLRFRLVFMKLRKNPRSFRLWRKTLGAAAAVGIALPTLIYLFRRTKK